MIDDIVELGARARMGPLDPRTRTGEQVHRFAGELRAGSSFGGSLGGSRLRQAFSRWKVEANASP